MSTNPNPPADQSGGLLFAMFICWAVMTAAAIAYLVG